MKYFFETTDSIIEGVGFSLFGSLHLIWIGVAVVCLMGNLFGYRKMTASGRALWRKIIAWLLIADELFKMAILIYSGHYGFSYLPFHLCSINIFLIAAE